MNRCSACGATIGKGKCLYCAMARMVGALPSTTLPPIGGIPPREAPRALPKELAAEPIVAWRGWSVDPGGLLLPMGKGHAFQHTWAARDATARCDRCTYLFGTPPGLNCTCGLYASKENASGVVWGKVALYGKVIEHERGYRAQHARILELHTDDPMLAALLRLNYGVPVTASPPAPRVGDIPPAFQRQVIQSALAGLPLVTIPTKRRRDRGHLALGLLNFVAVASGIAAAAADGAPSWITMLTVGNAFLAGIYATLYLRPRP